MVLSVEGVGHGDSLVHPMAGLRVDVSLCDSGLMFGAAAGSRVDSQQTAGTTWNWLAAVRWIVGFNCFLAGDTGAEGLD